MFKKLLLTSALLATFASAHAQSSQNFGVTGTVSPAPCTVTVPNGVVNLGSLTSAAVKLYPVLTGAASSTIYQVPATNLTLNIACNAATKVALSFVDNKAGKNFVFDANDPARFGIVDAAGTTAIGFYQIFFKSTTVDSTNTAIGQFLGAANGSTTFSTTSPAGMSHPTSTAMPGRTVAFAKTAGATAPDAVTTLSSTFLFETYLSKAYIDGATGAVAPTGSGTLTLVYL